MVSSKFNDNLSSTQERATSYVVSVTVMSFFVGLAMGIGLPWLYSFIFSQSTTDATKTTVTVITGLVTGGLLLRTPESVKKKADRLISRTIAQARDVPEEVVNKYACRIRDSHKGREAIRKNTSDEFCDDCRKRDAIIRGFAYNDDAIRRIALFATNETLEKTSRNIFSGKRYSQGDRDILFEDIYVYLRAWLVMSAAYGCDMEIDGFITQNFPSPQKPDKKVYITAIELAQYALLEDEHIRSLLNKYLDDKETDEVRNILSQYLTVLISKLKKNIG